MKSVSTIAAGLALSVALVAPALAGPGADLADAHFKAIAAGDVAAVTSAYGKGSVFQWVGGPLDGDYRGKDAIAGVWKKFTKAQGKLKIDVSDVKENANPKGVTVSANVKFTGKATIPVRYVLTWREGVLVNEVWQIDPALGKY